MATIVRRCLPSTKSSKLSLYCAGIEQPITVNDGGDDKFDAADDSIELPTLVMMNDWPHADDACVIIATMSAACELRIV